jgi:hypothetical protein
MHMLYSTRVSTLFALSWYTSLALLIIYKWPVSAVSICMHSHNIILDKLILMKFDFEGS